MIRIAKSKLMLRVKIALSSTERKERYVMSYVIYKKSTGRPNVRIHIRIKD